MSLFLILCRLTLKLIRRQLNDSKIAMSKERLGETDKHRRAQMENSEAAFKHCDHLVREEGKLALLHV